MQFWSEHIEDGNPVFAGGFHANVIAVIFDEPMFEPSKIFVERGEAFLHVRECPHLGDGYDGGNEKTFVDIDATADGGNDFHVGNPPFMVEERHCLSMPSKNDKSMPMISVRSKRSTYLCLSGGMEFIMSKWKETQDNIVRELHIDNVTEEIKQRVSASIVNEVLPPIEDAVNKFSTIIQA